MHLVVVLVNDGFETIEALGTVDLLRRAGVRTRLVSTNGSYQLISAQHVQVTADSLFEDIYQNPFDCVVIPGGLPSVRRLHADERVRVLLRNSVGSRSIAASGCAPSLLAELGLLVGRQAVVLPGFESALSASKLVDGMVAVDGDFITCRGAAGIFEFAKAIVGKLSGEKAAQRSITSIGL